MRLASVILLASLAAPLIAQPITFTGDVQADFPPTNIFADPGGLDVSMPPALSSNTSGWDMLGFALAYDQNTDELYIGIDTQTITGDADGDGDPGATSAALAGLGGQDLPDLQGTESVTIVMDVDDDGVPDVIFGTPLGNAGNNMVSALFVGDLNAPPLGFGAFLGSSVTPFVSPSASQPDLEITVSNFSDIVVSFAAPGQASFGVQVFCGSMDDDRIGEDYLPGVSLISVPTSAPCFPIPNQFDVRSVKPGMGNTFLVNTEYRLIQGYGCCIAYSTTENQQGWTLPVDGSPLMFLGNPNDFNSFVAVDLGVPGSAPFSVNCKEQAFVVTPGPLTGMTIFGQTVAYPDPDAPPPPGGPLPWFSSNPVSFVHP